MPKLERTSDEHCQAAGALFEALLAEAEGVLRDSPDGSLIATHVIHAPEGQRPGTSVVLKVQTPQRVHLTCCDLEPAVALRLAKLLGEVLA